MYVYKQIEIKRERERRERGRGRGREAERIPRILGQLAAARPCVPRGPGRPSSALRV